jgi:RNA polymerase sigma-70 factor (ECF subfamily)
MKTEHVEFLDQVVARARKLDPAAFDELVDCYAPRLFGFFYRNFSRHDVAEDLVQETFLRVVRTIRDYREEGRFEAWLFRIAGNLARDCGRRAVNEPVSESEAAAIQIADEHSPIALRAEDDERESSDRMQKCLDRLPPAEREVILMRHYGGLSFAEIAAYCDAPLGTVLARSHRGLGKLRAWLESNDE